MSTVCPFLLLRRLPGYAYTCEGHLGCFQFGAIMNKASMKIPFCVKINFHFSGTNTQKIIAGPYVVACIIILLMSVNIEVEVMPLFHSFY